MCNPTLNLVLEVQKYMDHSAASPPLSSQTTFISSHTRRNFGGQGGDGLTGWSDGRWWIFEGRVGGIQRNGGGGLMHLKLMIIAEDIIHLALGTCSLVLYVLGGGLLGGYAAGQRDDTLSCPSVK